MSRISGPSGSLPKKNDAAVDDFGEQAKALSEPAFDVPMASFVTGKNIPVDIYWGDEPGQVTLLIKKGINYSAEAHEIVVGSGIENVNIPLSQRGDFDKYRSSISDEQDQQRKKGFDGKFTNPVKVAEEYAFFDNYVAASIRAMLAGTTPLFSLFYRKKDVIRKLHENGSIFDEDELGRWLEEDLNIVIRKEEREAYQEYLKTTATKSPDPTVRAAVIRENSKLIVADLAEHPRSEQLMGDTKNSVSDLTSSIIENPETFYGLTKINNYDYYTFTHSVNVATLSLALAMEHGIDEKRDLQELGLGSILHDLGKAQVPPKLINKPGKLTDEEFRKVRGHVMLGYEMLKQNPSIPERAFYPLLQHHEKLSGNGYPNKLQADEIHLFGRISAIIDIYDALTTQRSYKKAFTPFDALTLMSKNKSDFDHEVFDTFVRLISHQKT